ncbi:MAG: RNA-binding transcriptional accessory protein [Oligoflexales bacterium]|nr:RNA-binding transcriptional accessory protein [Oligoflexales bacterium]
MVNIVSKISSELSLQDYQVHNVVKLLFQEDCTIPFIARYRKEMTGTLDEVAIRDIRDRYLYLEELETNKVKYLKVVEELCKAKPELMKKFPEIREKFENCETKQQLEDLYLPYKPKRRTKAQIAREKGLDRLLEKILEGCTSIMELDEAASEFVTPADSIVEPSLKVLSLQDALNGARDILAETVSETAEYRSIVRDLSFSTGMLVSKKGEDPVVERVASESTPTRVAGPGSVKMEPKRKIDPSKYENYYDYKEPINTAQAHRVMAVRRGEAEKLLKVTIEVDTENITGELKAAVFGKYPGATSVVKDWIEGAVEDSYKRLISPSIETEIRLMLKNKAETEAIKVFSNNIEKLLLLPPIPNKVVMGVDPGLRTGSKLAVVSDTGKFLGYATIFPDLKTGGDAKSTRAKEDFLGLINQYNVQYIAIGNGTGGREISRFISSVLAEAGLRHIKRLTVNEAGASVYSTDAIAREEFPELDPTIRSAISIARRLQDPLAELVKIDPRSIGVGQYQHDVNVTKLSKSLSEVVESCVNRVGVNINTASFSLLSYVSGIGKALAKNIVGYRDKIGKFPSRTELQSVPGLGPKAYTLAAGFLKVPESGNPLDNSSVHPESYGIVERMAADLQKSLSDLVENRELIDQIRLEQYVSDTIGMPTLLDILKELQKPGRDPREDGSRLHYSDEVGCLEDLKIDMVLPGTITNVTNFGAFVDIGVHQDGLVHISELTDKFVQDPTKEVSVGQVVNVRIIDVDLKRRRISLSMRNRPQEGVEKKSEHSGRSDEQPGSQQRGQKGGGQQNHQKPHDHRDNRENRGGTNSDRKNNRPSGQNQRSQNDNQKKRDQRPHYTVNDLMAKFNRR